MPQTEICVVFLYAEHVYSESIYKTNQIFRGQATIVIPSQEISFNRWFICGFSRGQADNCFSFCTSRWYPTIVTAAVPSDTVEISL